MKTATFIKRPVLSCVLSVFVVILDIIGLLRLPMEQFPEIAPPTVRVSTTYTGANAETLQRSVIAPLEEAINGVEGINYMTSSALLAARHRLRPIIMTSATMILGLLPMIFATGVGSNGSGSLAIGVIGGMILGTTVLLYITPTLFTILCRGIRHGRP